jgi:hypothetical protein
MKYKLKKFTSIFIGSLLFIGCFDLLDLAYWKDGNYRLSTNAGDPSCLALTNEGIMLLECVKSIGSNKKYIIATQIDNQGKTWYWLIKKEKSKYDEKPKGPFDLSQFSKIKTVTGISELQFERSFQKN